MKIKILTIILSLLLIGAAPTYAAYDKDKESPNFFAMAGDLVVARPLLLATTIVGGIVFIVSSPFSALGGNIGEAADVLVKTPAKATFKRCLGCSFSSEK